ELARRRVLRRRDGVRIAQRLRRDPVLAIRAVQIAAEHPEAERERAGMRVEERFLLDWIALHAADVPPGDVQRPTLVVADLAHTERPIGNRAAMPAREAPQPALVDGL